MAIKKQRDPSFFYLGYETIWRLCRQPDLINSFVRFLNFILKIRNQAESGICDEGAGLVAVFWKPMTFNNNLCKSSM